MELSRLRAENVRLKRECEILKKQRRTSRETHCEVRLDGQAAGIYARRDVRVLDVGVSGYQFKPDDPEPKMWINRAARTNPPR